MILDSLSKTGPAGQAFFTTGPSKRNTSSPLIRKIETVRPCNQALLRPHETESTGADVLRCHRSRSHGKLKRKKIPTCSVHAPTCLDNSLAPAKLTTAQLESFLLSNSFLSLRFQDPQTGCSVGCRPFFTSTASNPKRHRRKA